MRYHVIYEKAKRNYSAWSPDLLGCVAVGDTLEETRRMMREAILFHLEGMAEDGDIRPRPTGYYEDFGHLARRVVVQRRRPGASNSRRRRLTARKARPRAKATAR